LIELMISVSLIGILISVAVPQYRGFQARARQVEAKIALSAIYKAEKIWFAESGGYTCALDGIGYNPEEVSPRVHRGYYLQGFPLTMCLGDKGPPSGTNNMWLPSKWARPWHSDKIGEYNAQGLYDYCCGDQGPPAFRAQAWGSVLSTTSELDGWAISSDGDLDHIHPQP
jgi:type II secretory pathway pseudopilin PulG